MSFSSSVRVPFELPIPESSLTDFDFFFFFFRFVCFFASLEPIAPSSLLKTDHKILVLRFQLHMSRQNLRFFLRLALLLGSLSLSHAIPSPSSNENGDTNVQASEEITSVSIVSSGGSSEPTVTSSTKVSSLTSQSDKSDSSCDFSGPKVIGYYAASDTNILPIAEIPFSE